MLLMPVTSPDPLYEYQPNRFVQVDLKEANTGLMVKSNQQAPLLTETKGRGGPLTNCPSLVSEERIKKRSNR